MRRKVIVHCCLPSLALLQLHWAVALAALVVCAAVPAQREVFYNQPYPAFYSPQYQAYQPQQYQAQPFQAYQQP